MSISARSITDRILDVGWAEDYWINTSDGDRPLIWFAFTQHF